MNFNAHFGLRRTPFTRELPIAETFTHPDRDELVEALVRVVDQRMSAALIGPAGLGKTVVMRELMRRLPDVRYRVHYVNVTSLSKRDMCREIARTLDLAPAGTYPRLVLSIQQAVEARTNDDGVRTVLILDDAHEIRPDVLAILKTLTNFDMDSRLLLSVILVGQPGLAKLLRRPELEDVAQRLTWYGRLRPLSREETRAYIEHRCTVAGATTPPFDARALDALYEMGRGNPRALDHLARRSMEVAHLADEATVGSQHVLAARATLQP